MSKQQLAISRTKSNPKPKRGHPLPGSTVSTDETKDLAAIQPTVEPARSSWGMAKWQLAKAKEKIGALTANC
jgi:hypothetical protein